MKNFGDRRRRIVVCACGCGKRDFHQGHGYIKPCWQRWVYHGRPAEGPPPPGTTPRRQTSKPIPQECPRGHRLDEANLLLTPQGRKCRACKRESDARSRELGPDRHDGHDTITTVDGRLYCRTCLVGADYIDEIAVERAMSGDPAPGLTVAERHEAILRLRRAGLTYALIAERVGCSLRTAWRTCKQAGMTTPHRQVIRETVQPAA